VALSSSAVAAGVEEGLRDPATTCESKRARMLRTAPTSSSIFERVEAAAAEVIEVVVLSLSREVVELRMLGYSDSKDAL
jgi:hypothetical protein